MAKLYITEFSAAQAGSNYVPNAVLLLGTEQTPVVVGAGSLQSAAFASSTELIRLISDVTCSILVGANPTATTSTLRLVADSPEYFRVAPGHKVAVIANT